MSISKMWSKHFQSYSTISGTGCGISDLKYLISNTYKKLSEISQNVVWAPHIQTTNYICYKYIHNYQFKQLTTSKPMPSE